MISENNLKKTKNMNKHIIRYAMLAVAFLLVGMSFTACHDDDDSGSGTPVITGVRVPDPAKADSLFTKSGPGQIIAIIGQNLDHTLKVYINDQEVYFNPMMNTDHSLIVTVPTETDGFVLTAFDSTLKDEIRVETTHGTAVYNFKVTAPGPQISRIQASYPRQAGDSLYIYGLNLVDVEKIYFTDLAAAQLDTTVWTTVGGNHVEVPNFSILEQDHHLNTKTNSYETTSVVGIQIPNLGYADGALVVETAGGTSYISYYKNPGLPVISSISSDMPVYGETLVIRGNEFVQVESVAYGDVTLGPSDFTVADTEDEIRIRFRETPSEGCRELTVTTPGGKTSVPFYNYSCLLVDFDEIGTNLGWSPAAEVTDECDDETPPYTSSGNFGSFNLGKVAQQWWGTMAYYIKEWGSETASGHNLFSLPDFDVIPADAPLENVYLACEVFNNNTRWDLNSADEPKNAYVRYYMVLGNGTSYEYDNFSWDDYDVQLGKYNSPVLGTIDGEQPMGQWYRHTISLAEIGMKGMTYGELKAAGLDELRMQIINQSTKAMDVDFYIDNIRIYYPNK